MQITATWFPSMLIIRRLSPASKFHLLFFRFTMQINRPWFPSMPIMGWLCPASKYHNIYCRFVIESLPICVSGTVCMAGPNITLTCQPWLILSLCYFSFTVLFKQPSHSRQLFPRNSIYLGWEPAIIIIIYLFSDYYMHISKLKYIALLRGHSRP
jgi:hypothetical protein